MAQVRRITVVGEDILHRPCREVVAFGTAELAGLVEDMFLTMAVAEGAGLAANQVGVDLRVFVYDCRDETGARHVGHICNPVVEQQKARRLTDDKEGCLSVPGPYLRLARPDHAVVHGFDIHGAAVTVEGHGYFARCLHHETDHLNGHLYLDRLPERTRRKALKEMAEKRAAIFTRRAARAAAHTADPTATAPTTEQPADPGTGQADDKTAGQAVLRTTAQAPEPPATRRVGQAPEPAPTRRISQTSEPAATRGISQASEPAATRESGQAPERATTRRASQTTEQATTRGISRAPEQATTRGISRAPERATTRGVGW